MKIPVCQCGHTLKDHMDDDGKRWQKDGCCVVGWFDEAGRKLKNGCHCAEFRYKVQGS